MSNLCFQVLRPIPKRVNHSSLSGFILIIYYLCIRFNFVCTNSFLFRKSFCSSFDVQYIHFHSCIRIRVLRIAFILKWEHIYGCNSSNYQLFVNWSGRWVSGVQKQHFKSAHMKINRATKQNQTKMMMHPNIRIQIEMM